jgi:hypothetical protein
MAYRDPVHVLIARVPVAIRVAVVLLGVGLCALPGTPAQAQAPTQVQAFDSFGSQRAPVVLANDAWVRLTQVPHSELKIDVKTRSWLRVSMGRYGHGCRVCGCFSTVKVEQDGHVLELDLAPVFDPSKGLCRALPRTSGAAVVGPLDPGTWTLQGVHGDDISIQPDPG